MEGEKATLVFAPKYVVCEGKPIIRLTPLLDTDYRSRQSGATRMAPSVTICG
jgi:hypothetical protein